MTSKFTVFFTGDLAAYEAVMAAANMSDVPVKRFGNTVEFSAFDCFISKNVIYLRNYRTTSRMTAVANVVAVFRNGLEDYVNPQYRTEVAHWSTPRWKDSWRTIIYATGQDEADEMGREAASHRLGATSVGAVIFLESWGHSTQMGPIYLDAGGTVVKVAERDQVVAVSTPREYAYWVNDKYSSRIKTAV